jgi:hypothetical protein
VSEPYIGEVEYAAGATAHLEIDDLDSPSWRGLARAILLNATAPELWLVGVHLVEGPRSGEYASADLDRTHSPAVFIGREPFGPSPPGIAPFSATWRAAARSSGSQPLPELLRVYPIGTAFDFHSETRVLCSIEVWSDRVVVRDAGRMPRPPKTGERLELPNRGTWEIRDDRGTVFISTGGGSGGTAPLYFGHRSFVPAPPADARRLFIGTPSTTTPTIELDLT